MTQLNNAMEVFKLLPKTNCRKCNEKTCLAFAGKVFLRQKELELCPFIEQDVLNKFQGQPREESMVEQHQTALMAEWKNKISACNLKAAAERTGGTWSDGKLTLRIFGKPFSIDNQGNMFSDIHINPWITAMVFEYVLHCKGVPLTGKWVPYRELQGGREKNGLFVQLSEKPFKQIADRYPELFEDLILIFNGRETDQHFESDISLVLSPLPKLPMLVCYWKPEEGMDSELHLFFDSSAEMNANVDIAYGVGAGIVVMFEKIALRHGIR